MGSTTNDILGRTAAGHALNQEYAFYHGSTVVAQHVNMQSLSLTHSDKVELNAVSHQLVIIFTDLQKL